MPTHATRVQMQFFGRVQGVGFRMTACEIARGFDVTGWVCNEPDGSVLLEAQGDREDVESYLTNLQERMSTLIDRIDRTPISTDHDETGFDIRY